MGKCEVGVVVHTEISEELGAQITITDKTDTSDKDPPKW